MADRVVLAFSGSQSSVAAVKRLARSGDNEVVTLTLDFGDGQALEPIRDRALAAGAVRAHVLDVRDEFAGEYLMPCLRAGVLAGGCSSPRPALRRALNARKLRDIAALEGATILAGDLEPSFPIVERKGVNSDQPALVEIAFVGGAPRSINGVAMALPELIGTVATIAAEQGIADASTDAVLQAAHTELVKATVPPDLFDLCTMMRGRYSAAIAAGDWFARMRTALDALFAAAQADATGAVQMKLFNGECAAVRVAAQGRHDDTLVRPV